MFRCRWRSIILFAVMLSGPFGFQKVNATTTSAENFQIQFAEGEHSRITMLRYLAPALLQAGKAGRIYYAASCRADGGVQYAFPKIDVQPPNKDLYGLAAVQKIFEGDENVVIEEKPPGIIRIRIGKFPDDILKTEIYHLAFLPNDNYNAYQKMWEIQKNSKQIKLMGPPGEYDSPSAIEKIERSDEVQVAEHRLNLREGNGIFDYGSDMPLEGRPYISAPLDHVTMDGALDVVAQTFKGIVMYGACTNQPYYAVDFAGGPPNPTYARP